MDLWISSISQISSCCGSPHGQVSFYSIFHFITTKDCRNQSYIFKSWPKEISIGSRGCGNKCFSSSLYHSNWPTSFLHFLFILFSIILKDLNIFDISAPYVCLCDCSFCVKSWNKKGGGRVGFFFLDCFWRSFHILWMLSFLLN